MKYPGLIIFLYLIITACSTHPRNTAKEKMLCGQWMTMGEKYNHERYHFKADGTFTDTEAGSGSMFREAKTWEVKDGRLALTYKNHIIVPFNYTTHYRILNLNDSVLVLTGSANRRHPARNMTFKKMKLGGKFIRA
jgi:hypothetical protein